MNDARYPVGGRQHPHGGGEHDAKEEAVTRYRYYTCHVFTDTRFVGQPAAAARSERLNGGQMLRSPASSTTFESTFVLSAGTGARPAGCASSRPRPRCRSPHPNIRHAFVPRPRERSGRSTSAHGRVRGDAGPVPVAISMGGNGRIRCELTARSRCEGRGCDAASGPRPLDWLLASRHGRSRTAVASVGLRSSAELKDRTHSKRCVWTSPARAPSAEGAEGPTFSCT